MGQADHRHFGGHHGVRGQRHLFDGLEEHLPHPRQRAHRQAAGHVLPAALFVGGRRRVLGCRRVDLDDRDPVRDLGQVAEDGHGVGAIGVLRRKLRKRGGGVALHDQIEQVERAAPVGKAQHGADLFAGRLSGAVGDGLVHQAHRVTDRAFGGAGDQREGVLRQFRAFEAGHLGEVGHHHLGFDPFQVEALAARQDRDGDLADFGGGEDEFDVGGGFLQRLQKRVEGRSGQHMHFVDDVDLEARAGRPVVDRIDDLADVADPGARGCVHLHHVDVAAFGDGDAGFANAARFGGGAAFAVGADAVQALGDDPGGGGLAHPADAGHHEGMRDPVGRKGVLQGADHRLLPDQVGKGLRAVLAGKDLVGFLVGHGTPVTRGPD